MLVLLRNSARDGRKGDKMAKRWLGPYKIVKQTEKGKGLYQLCRAVTGQTLKKACRYCKEHSVQIVLQIIIKLMC